MCGIAGYLSLSRGIEVDENLVKQMTDSIAHRGPDGEGKWIDDERTVALGHRRLSIIDLSKAGRQPMHYLNRYVITFNGEIYNYIELKEQLVKQGYTFHSGTDTEVIMALYDQKGTDCLKEMDGMFSFAIWDIENKELFCARDRFGEKPFYYAFHKGTFYFASEMKALWIAGVPKDTEHSMVYNYFIHSLVDSIKDKGETFFKGIRKLPASHFAVIKQNEDRLTPQRYWDLKTIQVDPQISVKEAEEKVQQLLFTSISRRLRSDVSIGSSLSGGIDSSVVVYIIDQLNPDKRFKQQTFSARFPGYIKDETHYQRLVIDQCNVIPHFVEPTGESLLHELDEVIYHQEEPFQHASMVAQFDVYKLAKQNNVIVLLDGQGADEITGGYHYLFQAYFNGLKKTDPAAARKETKAYYELHANNSINEISKRDLKFYLKRYLPVLNNTLKAFKNKATGEFYLEPGFRKEFQSNGAKQEVFSNLTEALYYDSFTYGLENLLRYADRNSMAHSREVRLPFLSHEFVEYFYSLPDSFKLNQGWTKWIIRKAFNKKLPDEIMWRKEKVGYEPPQDSWLTRPAFVKEIERSAECLADHKILNTAAVSKMNPHAQWKIFMTAKALYM